MNISQNSGPGKIFRGYEYFSKLWAREYILWIRKFLKTLGQEKYSVDMNISQNSGPGKIFCGYEDFSKLWAREYILWIRKFLKTLGHEKYSVDMNISQNCGPGIGFTFLFSEPQNSLNQTQNVKR